MPTSSAVSRSNELALVLHGIHNGQIETMNGMLARAPIAGGSPRELLPDVRWADWDNSGRLAVVHNVDGHSRLEYPIGNVLYESPGWISNVRFSPQGDKIAFMDHPALWDTRGNVTVMDTAATSVHSRTNGIVNGDWRGGPTAKRYGSAPLTRATISTSWPSTCRQNFERCSICRRRSTSKTLPAMAACW